MTGLGVDQVVQLEMVLPNGVHVKFGPTEWEDASAEGFTVPRTKVVSGVCRSNPDEHDEEKWIWERCPEDFDINFNSFPGKSVLARHQLLARFTNYVGLSSK